MTDVGWDGAGVGDRGEAAEDRRCIHNVDLQGGLVCALLDDLVIALYVTVDELVEPRRGPGCRPRLSDAELVWLAVAQVLLGYHSERRWLRAVHGRLGTCSPTCVGRRPTTAGCAAPPPWSPSSWVPWRWPARRGVTSGGCWTRLRSPAAPRGRRSSAASWLAGPATLGRQPSPLLLGPQAVCAGRSRRPAGGVVPGQPQRRREAIFDTLKDQLGLERHGAHTIHGLWVRVAQRLLALAAGVWFNLRLAAPLKRSLVAFDH